MLKGLEGSVAPRPAAVPVKAEISRDDSQPSDEARSSCKLELQKPLKAIAGQLLANMEVTIRCCVFVAGAGWTKKQKDGQVHMSEAADLIGGFLQASQASLGSSKSLVDLSGEGEAVTGMFSWFGNARARSACAPR